MEKLVAKARKIPGLTFFKFDKETGLLTEVVGNKVIVDSKCLYIQALNKTNAVRKFSKLGYIINNK